MGPVLRQQSAVVFLRVGILLLSLLLPLAAAEIYFRIRYDPTATLDGRHVPDPWVGWDTDPPVLPLENTGRPRSVFFLGDSFVDGKAWMGLAQREAARRGVPFDGFALGVSGHGTTQQFLKLQRAVDVENPDLVVLLFFAWNDLRDNVRTPSLFYSPSLLSRPYFVPRDDHFILRNDSPSLLLRLLARSEVYVRVLQRVRLQWNAAFARRDIHRIATLGMPVGLYYDEPASWTPFYRLGEQEKPYVRLAYDTTEHALREMKHLLDRRGIPLLILGIDNAFTVDPDVLERRIPDPASIDIDLPLRRIEELLRELRIPFLSALPALRAEQRRIGRKIYNGPEGNIGAHLEPEGEAVLGKIAAQEIMKILEKKF